MKIFFRPSCDELVLTHPRVKGVIYSMAMTQWDVPRGR